MADPTFVNSPAQTVKKKFSASGAGTAPDAGPPLGPLAAASVSDLGQQPLPTTMTPDQIGQMMQPLLDQAQSMQAPADQPQPAQLSPLGTFLGALAGNLATTFTNRPQYALEAHQFLHEDQQRRQQIEDQNTANRLLFDKDKRTQLVALRGKILSAQVDRAIESGDLERADVATRNLAKFQEGLRREDERTQQVGREREIKLQGEEARKTQAQKFSLEVEEGRDAKTKPLTSKEYLTAINDINKNKEIKDPGFFERIGRWARSLGGNTPDPTDRQTALETTFVTGLGGEPQVRPTAWRSLRQSIRRRLNLPTTGTLDPAQRMKFETELTRYGLELGGLEP